MKRITFVLILLIIGVSLGSCAPLTIDFEKTTDINSITNGTVEDAGEKEAVAVELITEKPKPVMQEDVVVPPISNWGIEPGIIEVGNFYPGARADSYDGHPITINIYNGMQEESDFSVKLHIPNQKQTRSGFLPAPIWANEWFTITETKMTISSGEWGGTNIILEMPEDAYVPAPHWEVWIVVSNTSRGGMVVENNAVRFLVSMKD